jgi:ABC-type glycerol-3-phosphate transport system substrate-binding protein
MGIGDANMYIQLKYAAPELSGQWGVLPIPGVFNELDEVERWHPTYGGSSVIFSSSKKQTQTWDFIKWWSNASTQADYSYQIQSALGNKFLYMTANIEGFRESAWPIDTKYIILEQWQWIRSTGRVPGDYMLERELSNAWNHVVFDGANPRIAINEATLIINLELRRKLVEFDYYDLEGNLLKPYYIPTYDTIDWWFTDNDN